MKIGSKLLLTKKTHFSLSQHQAVFCLNSCRLPCLNIPLTKWLLFSLKPLRLFKEKTPLQVVNIGTTRTDKERQKDKGKMTRLTLDVLF